MQKIIHGDCLEKMREMQENSIDFIVTDPPYGLHFMGKKWDGRVPAIEIWAEALRVCKPGSMLAAFGGSRTHHHLMLAIEGAGWEIRDVVMWIYGSGFPKNHDVSKAIDKSKGLERDKETRIRFDGKIAGSVITDGFINGVNDPSLASSKVPLSELGHAFSGYGTALKPAYEPIILAMKPLDGTYAHNAEKWGVAGINVDVCRISGDVPSTIQGQSSKQGEIYGKDQRMLKEFIPNNKGRWPANLILDEEAAKELDEMTGILKTGSMKPQLHEKKNSVYSKWKQASPGQEGSSGGASRFFYCAKASSSERNRGLEKKGCNELQGKNYTSNSHPTVKPISLMKYIINLLAHPGSPVLLDPFCGSGSTLVAAKELGILCIGIEKEEEYVKIAEKRVQSVKILSEQLEMFV